MDAEQFLIGVVWLCVGGLCGGLVMHEITDRQWHRITIERGLAQYCPDTGEWAWIGECE